MKQRLLVLALFISALVSAQITIFDPATFSGDLPEGMEIVTINDTAYLQVVLAGWGSSLPLDPVEIYVGTHFTTRAKYAVGADNGGFTVDQINTFLKLANSDFTLEIAVAGAASSSEFADYSVDIASQGIIGNLQVAGQETSGWSAIVGDTLWVGKVDVYNEAPVSKLDVENVVVGAIDDVEGDFACSIDFGWDVDSLYLTFTITDDSIVNTGTAYQVDNIELYLDLDNSKNIQFPRNTGWHADDPTYDTNDFQLRLVPDVDFSVNNGTSPSIVNLGGVKQVYMETDTGYVFELNIAWDSLLLGFVPVDMETVIGFDALVSDNDAVASDANRNQITFNSATDKAFNDPSLWSTLLLNGGAVNVVPDVTAPDTVGNLTATVDGSSVTLSWDYANDNIATLEYIISQDDVEVKRVYAAETSNTTSISDLAEGTYEFSVVAVDNSGNTSAASTVSASIVPDALIINNADAISVYPNPVSNVLNIKGVEDITRIEVIGITGQVVATFETGSSINVSGLNSGIYIVKVYTENEIHTARIRKN